MSRVRSHPPLSADEVRGLWLGLIGVVIFAMTLPMTRLAVGPSADPQLPPLFVTAGRAGIAGLLSGSLRALRCSAWRSAPSSAARRASTA